MATARSTRFGTALLAAALLCACAGAPTSGPTHAALPGSGKSLEQFNADDADCRTYAVGLAGENLPNFGRLSVGVGIGTRGASVGVGTGPVYGPWESGSYPAPYPGPVNEHQRKYDDAYMQCMYARNHQIPVAGPYSGMMQRQP